jgi:hypothetical protein
VHHDVLGLDVAVHHALTVSEVKSSSYRTSNVHSLFERQAALAIETLA